VTSQSAAGVEEGYDHAGLWAAITVMFGWQVIAVLPTVVSGWRVHGLVGTGAGIWLIYTALGGVSAWVTLRGGGQSPALPLLICPVLLAGVAVGSLTIPGGFFGIYNWPFTATGWFALVALWRRRLPELLAFFAANTLVGVAMLAALHETDRLSLARFITEAVSSSVLEITIFVGGKTVAAMARRGAEAEEALARARIARLAADAVQAARRVNYESIKATVAQLLERLAAGDLDLAEPATRQHVAVAVTRLRRYLVETDEVPDQLSHELHACADAAERRGIAVDLMAPVGPVPQLPVDVRHALTDPVIQVLGATATRARITVVAAATQIAVAVVADACLQAPVQATHDAVQVAQDAEGGLLWVQASWTGRSPSRS
jgi:hypothetical protein